MSRGLDAAAANELIEHALKSLAGESVASKATPTIEALFELAAQSSRAAGKRDLSITSIEVHTNGNSESKDQGPVSTIFGTRPTSAAEERIPIASGGTGYACCLVDKGPTGVLRVHLLVTGLVLAEGALDGGAVGVLQSPGRAMLTPERR